MAYFITKTYGPDLGLSACFRQPRAKSHCKQLHGYALSFSFKFGCAELDENNWVLDFGSLKPLKQWLCDTFDHRTILAHYDPAISDISDLYAKYEWQQPIIMEHVGCEHFAAVAYWHASGLLSELNMRAVAPVTNRPFIVSVEVREHGANSAIYTGPDNAQ